MPEGLELDGRHRATVEKIFNHPIGHNVQWHDVLSLLQSVAAVTEGRARPGTRSPWELRPRRSTPRDITTSTSSRS